MCGVSVHVCDVCVCLQECMCVCVGEVCACMKCQCSAILHQFTDDKLLLKMSVCLGKSTIIIRTLCIAYLKVLGKHRRQPPKRRLVRRAVSIFSIPLWSFSHVILRITFFTM